MDTQTLSLNICFLFFRKSRERDQETRAAIACKLLSRHHLLPGNPVQLSKTRRGGNKCLIPCIGLQSLTDVSLYSSYLWLKWSPASPLYSGCCLFFCIWSRQEWSLIQSKMQVESFLLLDVTADICASIASLLLIFF